MDSCHLFNFLFGAKKATTELSKCFTDSVGSKRSYQEWRRGEGGKNVNSRQTRAEPGCSSGASQSAPASPLKQLQMKIANFALTATTTSAASASTTSSKSHEEAKSKQSTRASTASSCADANLCGTYRATLVHSRDDEDELGARDGDNDKYGKDKAKHKQGLTQEANFYDLQAHPDDCASPLKSEPKKTDPNADWRLGGESRLNDKDQRQKLSRLIEPLRVDESEEIGQKYMLNQEFSSQNPESNRIHSDDKLGKAGNDNIMGKQKKGMQQQAAASGATKCKRVVLYDNPSGLEHGGPVVPSSAEIYSIVSELGEARAKLRRVSSISTNGHDEQMESAPYEPKEGETKEAKILSNAISNDDDSVNKNNDTSTIRSKETGENLRDKRSFYVQSLVLSFESNKSPEMATSGAPTSMSPHRVRPQRQQTIGYTKPVTVVKPLPPKTPPKTNKAKCLNIQLSLNKPTKINHLFQDDKFLIKFFNHLEPLDRCVAAQVCRLWRDILYSNRNYWKDLVNVIDCIQLRREHLVECIVNTLQTAKLKQQQQQQQPKQSSNDRIGSRSDNQDAPGVVCDFSEQRKPHSSSDSLFDIDQEDVWRIQELCNRYTHTRVGHATTRFQTSGVDHNNNNIGCTGSQSVNENHQTCTASKSSSIPSQISSTLSSVSLSSLITPLSESSRIESIKGKLYTSLDDRGFDAICLFGATDDDVDDLICKLPASARQRIVVARFNNCCLTNRALESFVSTFNRIEELELSGCNEITNSFELKALSNSLKRLIITDCINIADGIAQKLEYIIARLDELTIQAYHLTDAFLDYLSVNTDTSRLKRLELPNCKELTNQSLITIAKYFPGLEILSISGSTKMSDEGIEILAEQAQRLKSLDLSWCTRITDASLECIACDLSDSLTDLILDRNIHITDMGLGYLATMNKLTLLHIRWCRRITDVGLESVLSIKSLRYLSLAGLHQVTARSLLCLIEANLLEVELTNCPAVDTDLTMFLSARLPKCNIIF